MGHDCFSNRPRRFQTARSAETLNVPAFRAEVELPRPRRYPRGHGPVRLIVPWKYGFKSIKSIVRIELAAERPGTFWNAMIPHEYGFVANVDPARPHPRWSQETERMIDTGEIVPTLPFNGYGDLAAHLCA